MRRVRRRRVPGGSFVCLLGKAPAVKPRIAIIAAIRAGEEQIVKEVFLKAAPSGSVDGRALAIGTCVLFSGGFHDNFSYSGLGPKVYTIPGHEGRLQGRTKSSSLVALR
jgi:hypothetical protein